LTGLQLEPIQGLHGGEAVERERRCFGRGGAARGVRDGVGAEDNGLGLRPDRRAQRYSDLARTIAGVSQKMLTQTLRTIERDGLVTRTITPSVPVRVDYELTALGETILPVVGAIKAWSESHIEEIHASRTAYDQLAKVASSAAMRRA
jgi:DNA-binding HxlR family transcriptional regulator